MISLARFLGGAKYVSTGTTHLLSWAYRLYRLHTAVPGTVFILPRATGKSTGGPKFVLLNETASSIFIARFGEGGAPLWEILGGYRAKFHLVNAETPEGDWVADIRQTGVSGAVPKSEAAVVGGVAAPTDVLRLQNATDTFISGTPSPNGRIDASSFQNRDELFVAGAVGVGGSDLKLDGYRNDTWRQVGPLPIAYGGAFGGFAHGKGFLLGGVGETRAHAFDPRSETWSARASLGFQRSDGASATVDGRIYLIAGAPALTPSCSYSPLLDSFAVLPGYTGINRRRQSGFGLMGKVYSCGGIDDVVGTHDLVDVLDVRTLSWSVGPPLPMGARSGGGAFAANRRGYYGGGRDGTATDKFDVASLRAGTWSSLAAWGAAKYGVGNSCGAAL